MAFARTALLASATKTSSDTGTIEFQPQSLGFPFYAIGELDVTAGGADSSDKLNVYIQAQLKSGDWVDVMHFTEVLGDAPAKRHVCKIASGLAETTFEASAALASGAVRNILSDRWRCRWAVTSGNAPTFTFSVTLMLGMTP